MHMQRRGGVQSAGSGGGNGGGNGSGIDTFDDDDEHGGYLDLTLYGSNLNLIEV